MTNKQRLDTLLHGGIPDVPPHFELLFQIEQEYFGMDVGAVKARSYGSEAAYTASLEQFYIEVRRRLIEECGWAAVPPLTYDLGYVDYGHLTRLKQAIGDRALVWDWNGEGVYWMPSGTDIMDFVIMLFERPEEMHTNARKKCDAAKELATRQADAGVDFLIMNSDFGFNEGPFISPEHFQQFVTPYMTEIVEHVHNLGLPIILHTDGDIRKILDQLVGTGVDGYQSIDSQGHMDIQAVRAAYPDWLLMGNVPCNLLQDADEADIRAAVRHCMQYGGIGKRYIFSTSNTIFPGMPPQSYRIMLDEYRRLCAAGG